MAWLHRSLALVAQGRHGPCLLGLFSLALAGPTAAGEETRGEGGASGPWEGNGAPASPSHATPVVGASLCPTPDAVWQELLTLLPRDDLVGRLRSFGSAGAAVRIEDLGASFRVSLLDKARAYHEEARDCARRARMGALFAALVIDPTALLGSNALEVPAAPPAVTPPPPVLSAPAPAEVAPLPMVRIEVAPAVASGLDGQTVSAHWGGVLRLAMGRGKLAPVVGAGGFLPATTSIGGIRLRQWRMPADLSLRATLAGDRLDGYAEVGLAFALLDERALDLLAARSAIGVEFGGRVALGARLDLSRALVPFLAVAAEWMPDPPVVAALPSGVAGRTPHLWLTLSVGVSWGLR